ncbi:DUF2167 domain-containing protein [Pseudomonas sp. Fl5BN2]|uniref:DUF2167 domain-containing protein n=1 Tax=unclassified Pseudomonas TaxID=196821 RepID=UPI0013785B92|nr:MULTISPECIES: DUF2167 domain-containing protein [unclassified Pseudomonas]NBF01182.1 DUF2167 domain-containing protein [Pseudomonas sp. Fl5BN2]NBF10073.1 DUF2167 domain-containing protein [Pseudomonas sp. Fl4BN1]
MKYLHLLMAAAILCATPFFACAATSNEGKDAEPQTAEQFLASLSQRHGNIKLPGDIASLDLSNEFYYLSPKDTEKLLTEGWGNPPGFSTLGMIVPSAVSPLSAEGWGVIISYKDDGHISDADAEKINYQDLLKEMQEADKEDNQQRKEQGYSAIHLLGWAEQPSYDAQSHKMYWARELKAEGAESNTLNYSIRVLGREGVLELNAVASMDDLATIKREIPKVLAFTNFTDGNRYADYNPSTDKLASYGLAALVAGGIASKAGLFAKLGVLLLAGKKFIVLGVLAIAAFAGRLFKKKS